MRVVDFVAVLWAIWMHINNLAFRNGRLNPYSIILAIQDLKKMCSMAIETKGKAGHCRKGDNTGGA